MSESAASAIDGVGALRAFVVARVRGDTRLRRLGVTTVHDRVPAAAKLPYATFGPEQESAERAETSSPLCSTVEMQIDVWSDAVGRSEAGKIAAALRGLLNDAEGEEDAVAIQQVMWTATHDVPSEDGRTTHLALMFTCLIEAA